MLSTLLLVLLASSPLSANKVEAGGACHYNQQQGVCVQSAGCPQAKQIMLKGAPLEVCDNEGGEKYVCCTSKATLKCQKYIKDWKSRKGLPCLTCIGVYCDGFVSKERVSAIKGEFPHMAHLGYGPPHNLSWECGGSLISDRFVLTAAHCVSRFEGQDVTYVKLGWPQEPQASITVKVVASIVHPQFSRPHKYNDIALLELVGPVAPSWYIRPACLHVEEQINTSIAIGTGWSATELHGPHDSGLLFKRGLPLVGQEECQKFYIKNKILPRGVEEESMVCAGSIEPEVDTCQDSDGPLQVEMESGCTKMYSILGVSSFGIRCGLVPDVFTRVSHYVPWIESIVWPD